MPYSIQQFILTVSVVPVGVACVVGIVRFGRLERTLRYLVGLVLIAAIIEAISRGLWLQKKSNMFLQPLDTGVEFGLLAWIYRRALWPSLASRVVPAVVVVFSLASLLSYAEPGGIVQFNPVQRFVESLLVLTLVLLYFNKLISEMRVVHLEREPLFWISTGLLIYFAGNILIFISSNYVMQHLRDSSVKIWAVHAVLYMVLHGFYSLSLCIRPRS